MLTSRRDHSEEMAGHRQSSERREGGSESKKEKFSTKKKLSPSPPHCMLSRPHRLLMEI